MSELDFRVGGTATLFTGGLSTSIFTIDSVTDTTITSTTNFTSTIPVGTPLMPVRQGHVGIFDISSTRGYNDERELFNLGFEVTDNNTGAPTGDTSLGDWSTYNSKVLYDICRAPAA